MSQRKPLSLLGPTIGQLVHCNWNLMYYSLADCRYGNPSVLSTITNGLYSVLGDYLAIYYGLVDSDFYGTLQKYLFALCQEIKNGGPLRGPPVHVYGRIARIFMLAATAATAARTFIVHPI